VTLWAAVDALVAPRHVKLWRDVDGKSWTEWPTSPSLWEQLTEAVASSSALDGGGNSSRYRTPLDLNCMELTHTIRETIVDALIGHDQKPRATVPDSLRALASTVTRTNEDDLVDWWTYRLWSWCRQIRVALRLGEPLPRGIRGTACPECGETTAAVKRDDDIVRVPALTVDFTPDGYIRAAECLRCHAAWFRGEALWQLSDATRGEPLASGGVV